MFRIFNTENIDAFIQKNFSAHGCQIKYNATIGRKWLPRPTLILKDLSLSSSEPDTPTLNIAESKMGFGWSSLWSDAPILEKWILLNPTLTLDSKHHLPACLQQDPSSKESFQLNRIIINNGSIRYHTKEQNIALNNLQFPCSKPIQTAVPSTSAAHCKTSAIPSVGRVQAIWYPTMPVGVFPPLS